MASVQIADVRKAYGATQVIHGVDIDVSDVPAPPLRERSERRCLKPLRASTHDDFKAYA